MNNLLIDYNEWTYTIETYIFVDSYDLFSLVYNVMYNLIIFIVR